MPGMSGMPGMSASPPAAASSTAPAAAAPAATVAPVPNAPAYEVFDPIAPAVLPGTVHDLDFPIVDKVMTVAKGYVVHAWTFGGSVPGPTIRVHLGDTVRIYLRNVAT